jgi:hypothetical protein
VVVLSTATPSSEGSLPEQRPVFDPPAQRNAVARTAQEKVTWISNEAQHFSNAFFAIRPFLTPQRPLLFFSAAHTKTFQIKSVDLTRSKAHSIRLCDMVRNKLEVLRWMVVSPPLNPQAGGPPPVGCPRLLISHFEKWRCCCSGTTLL